jgi:hypothetical protein
VPKSDLICNETYACFGPKDTSTPHAKFCDKMSLKKCLEYPGCSCALSNEMMEKLIEQMKMEENG